jgi:4-hydroxybenzoyl-CoA reductase subunit beta
MLISQPFIFQSPPTVEAALDLLQNQKNAALLAGGTDYVPLLKYGLKDPAQLIGLDQIPYLKQIEKREKGLFIGAMNRLITIIEDRQVLSHCSLLADASRLVASPQIRNVGTIGGNICQDRRCIYFNQTQFWRQSISPCLKTGGLVCHQSPRSKKCRAIYHSDLAPALIALDARVECFDKQARHELPITTFINEHITTNGGIQTGTRLVCGIIIPKLQPGSWMGFVKQSVRESVDFPVMNAAVCYQPSHNESVQSTVSIVVGAVAPEPIALIKTQQLITKQIKNKNLSKSTWVESAVAEAQQKSQLILDTGLALSARKKAFGVVGRLIEKLADFVLSQSSNQ